MNPPTLLLALATASTALAAFVPIHGCEWVPSTTAVTDFVFLSNASNPSAPSSISWKAPAVAATCKTENATWLPISGHQYSVPCVPPENGLIQDILRVSGDGTTALIMFRAYAQCAASIYAFHYEAVFPLDCTEGSGGFTRCEAKGDVAANCTAEEYLPPIRPPPPPCYGCGHRN
ncbi:hypothetical protein P171DRAFT_427510 [Karstenula rhodostoma CBS 690.94]|uniref:Uncharacterized protein n=1 Tax=Karstenula rhodostoma CBS 690.94 TaxID=1392251 RepID=A0A9P4PQ77_9PLEO|nr:hypothetical protein P171DRAFT_427510 [Karstenula rhodostoma CBS 690.94]